MDAIDLDEPNTIKNSNNDGNNNKTSKKPTIEEKREIIQDLLETHFPSSTIFYFAISYCELGLAAIGLQSALIAYDAPLSRIGNGIWGGILAMLNGLLKLYMWRVRTYKSLVIFQTLTLPIAILSGVGLLAITGACLSKYPCEKMPSCSDRNYGITIGLHIVGYIVLIKNIASILVINFFLFGSLKAMFRNRLGLIEAYKELPFVFKKNN